MTSAADVKSGKGSRDENFPVASALISARHRSIVLAFYRFARAADDVADNPKLGQAEKFRLLDGLEATLLGNSASEDSEALPLRHALGKRAMAPTHALDLLKAFRQDVTKSRYRDWEELIDYCRHSANPVGRFVLDVHAEDQSTWQHSDQLCTALQIINHLQDCGKDFRTMDRVYLPLDCLTRHGARVEDLGGPKASAGLAAAIRELTVKTQTLMPNAGRLPRTVRDMRLSAETAVICKLANRILALLLSRDPLSERVHLSKGTALSAAAQSATGAVLSRALRPFSPAAATKGAAR